jgi:hypothetical protein
LSPFAYFVVLGLAAPAPRTPPDTDRDGLSDALERRTGTDPLSRDTDEDGVPDGIEDANRDGVVDPGETDPRVHGLFPGTFPYIPEPLVFDLVRGLGAVKGELEVNSLFVVPLRPYRGVLWAPELEYAFADGYAFELEIPMHDLEVDALKAAVQGTIPEAWPRFIHGWQGIVEYTIRGELEVTALYLAGFRPRKRTTLFAMVGSRATAVGSDDLRPELLLNPSIFIDAAETLTFGLENNLWIGPHRAGALVVPQVHWQIARHFRLQLGAGVLADRDGVSPVLATRLILE